MSGKLTVSGDSDDWVMFSRTPANGKPIFIRSRTCVQQVHEFAEKNFFARVRCTLKPEDVTETGLPKSTEALDAFEDALLAALMAAGAETYLIGVITGDGVRDLYFSAVDSGELPKALQSIEAERPFTKSLAKGDAAPFLKIMTLSPQDKAKASYHGVPTGPAGGIIGKLFGR